jgi:hypothetical protein
LAAHSDSFHRMSTITAIVEADPDGMLHLPLPAELRYGKVKELRRIYGFDPKTSIVQYAAARDRVHPEDGTFSNETFHEALREERGFEMAHRIVLPGGEVKHIHVLGHPVLVRSRRREDRWVHTKV